MKKLYDILEQLKTDTSDDLPVLLLNAGVSDFSVYEVGSSRDAKELGFFIYPSDVSWSYDFTSVTIIFQLQLYGVDEFNGAKYFDVVNAYFKEYDVTRIGATGIMSITGDFYPVDGMSTTFNYVTVTFDEELDSCDLD